MDFSASYAQWWGHALTYGTIAVLLSGAVLLAVLFLTPYALIDDYPEDIRQAAPSPTAGQKRGINQWHCLRHSSILFHHWCRVGVGSPACRGKLSRIIIDDFRAKRDVRAVRPRYHRLANYLHVAAQGIGLSRYRGLRGLARLWLSRQRTTAAQSAARPGGSKRSHWTLSVVADLKHLPAISNLVIWKKSLSAFASCLCASHTNCFER